MKNFLLLLIVAAIFFQSASSQDKLIMKPGKVSAGDFVINSPVVDSSSNAVVIADVGTCKFVGNDRGWFSIVFTELKRVKILNKNGFPAAEIHIGLYKRGDIVEKIKDLKGATYNLENGSVVATELDDKTVFEERISKNYIDKKFTFPAIREGSIIEYSYQVESDFLFHLPSWEFQGEYPCLWSSYEVSIPALFIYAILQQGNLEYFKNSTEVKTAVLHVSERPEQPYPGGTGEIYAVNTNITVKKWIMKDVPAMPLEDHTSSVENYISKLEFQLSGYRHDDQTVENKANDWKTLGGELLKDADFGRPITEDNPWISEEIKNIRIDGLADEEKARNIFAYVRDNYTCTRPRGLFLTEDAKLKDVIKSRSGSVSDLNLLLIAMLRNSALKADPVILSTRDHGTIDLQYPMLQKFNYLICQLRIEDRVYYLDASSPYLGFGKLELRCYNGTAMVINESPTAVSLQPGELIENKSCNIILENKGSELTGKYQAVFGYNASLVLRQKTFTGKGKKYFEEEEKKYAEDVTIRNGVFDSLRSYNDPVIVTYDVDVKLKNDGLFYFNPLLAEQIKENPFKAQHRIYPVELPYLSNDLYTLDMEVPKGYTVEELPKSQAFSLPGNKARFDYQITQVEGHIQVRCRLQLNQILFDVDEYENVRAFFALVINKENEQIVFKKMN